jgi:excisionase family DNA binding protein
MKNLVTPKQVAQAIGVSESSLKRWCDKGLLKTVRTAGGHRRLPLDGVVQYLRSSGQQIVRPELLGLPSTTGQGVLVIDRAADAMREALVAGDEDQCRRIAFDLFLSGQSVCDICDQVLARAFHEIGDRWECGEVAVYRERRGCEIALRTLYALRQILPAATAKAPLAVGGSLEKDPYKLPTTMVELTLRERGWRAESYGTLLPAATLCQAVHDYHPRLLWVSVSAIDSPEVFLREYRELHEVAVGEGTAVVVGGRALDQELRRQMKYSAHCDTMTHLANFVETLAVAPAK